MCKKLHFPIAIVVLREALKTQTGVRNANGAKREQPAFPKGKPRLMDLGEFGPVHRGKSDGEGTET